MSAKSENAQAPAVEAVLTELKSTLTAARLKEAGYTVDLLDLHAEGFDPRMNSEDQPDWDDRDKVYALKRHLADGTFMGAPVRTNSFGHRDREIPLRKPENGVRVVAVGDSVTFGHGVRAEQAWPERLEQRLAARYPSLAVEVVNTAVPGNSPFQEYYDLERLRSDAPHVGWLASDAASTAR